MLTSTAGADVTDVMTSAFNGAGSLASIRVDSCLNIFS